MAEYYSFEEVMGELNVDEEELKRMVSEGELRAFRSENKMKFKREDVENIRKGRVAEPTVILPSSPTPPRGTPSVEDTALDLPMPEIAEEKKPTEEYKPIVIDETSAGTGETTAAGVATKAPDETFAEEEEVGLAPPEPMPFEETAGATAAPTATAPAAAVRGTRKARTVYAQLPPQVEQQIEKRRAHWVWTLVMTLTMGVTLYYGMVLYDTLRFSSGMTDRPSAITEAMAGYFLNNYWTDPRWLEFHQQHWPKGPDGKPVAPPFESNFHRNYEWPGYPFYLEPDEPLPEAQLLEKQKQIRAQLQIPEGTSETEAPR